MNWLVLGRETRVIESFDFQKSHNDTGFLSVRDTPKASTWTKFPSAPPLFQTPSNLPNDPNFRNLCKLQCASLRALLCPSRQFFTRKSIPAEARLRQNEGRLCQRRETATERGVNRFPANWLSSTPRRYSIFSCPIRVRPYHTGNLIFVASRRFWCPRWRGNRLLYLLPINDSAVLDNSAEDIKC